MMGVGLEGFSLVSKMISLVIAFTASVAPAFGGVILPSESVVRGGLMVAPETYRGYDRKLGYDLPYGTKYFDGKASPYHIAAIEHDIKHQMVSLERNLAAARPYLASNPQILREAEEQLRALQHIHASRLLHGIESIRQLELQQEVLIHKVNEQLENSVSQLKHLAVLQHEISNKQKSPVRDALPETVEANRLLTAQLHAIEAAKAQEEVAHEIAKDAVDHAIAKDVVDHAITKEVVDRAIAKEVMDRAIAKDRATDGGIAHHGHEDGITRSPGVSSDEGVFRVDSPGIDPRTSSDSDDEGPSKEEDKPVVFAFSE